MKSNGKRNPLRAGDWVEVRSKQEILATLDSLGQLDGMPFMPEMFRFCGQRFQIYKRAHKTCDTVFPVRGRRVESAVHLDTRCDGSAHGGCQAGCLLFWKEDWLKPAGKAAAQGRGMVHSRSGAGCSEADVLKATQKAPAPDGEPVYRCQATQIPYATHDLDSRDVRQYIEDYTSGNVSLFRIFCGFVYMLYYGVMKRRGRIGKAMRWAYDTFYPLWRGAPFPRRTGSIPENQPTPTCTLNLQPGELVRIKPYKEILETLNTRNRNRGMYFDAEEVPYCGGTYRVLRRVERIVDEKTGKMLAMRTPSVILDSVICQSRYSECRLFCPRSIYPYWREIWLERAGDSAHHRSENPASTAARPASEQEVVAADCH